MSAQVPEQPPGQVPEQPPKKHRRRNRKPRSTRAFALGQKRLGAFVRWLFRVRAEGTEQIPQTGRLILCANHLSFIDPIVLAVVFPRPVNYMARSSLFTKPILGGILRRMGCIPVNREKPEVETFRAVRATLESENTVGIFPEGTRSRTGLIARGKPGVGMLVIRDNAPVIPAALYYPKKAGLFRPTRILFGAPIPQSELSGKYGAHAYQEIADRIMDEIGKLYDRLREQND